MVLVQWRTVYGTVETVAVPESEVPAGVQRTYVPGPPTAPPPTPSISHPAPVSNQAMVNFFRRAKSRNASAPRTPEVEIVPPPFVPQNPVVDPFPDEVEFLPPAAPPKLSTVTPPPPIVVVPPLVVPRMDRLPKPAMVARPPETLNEPLVSTLEYDSLVDRMDRIKEHLFKHYSSDRALIQTFISALYGVYTSDEGLDKPAVFLVPGPNGKGKSRLFQEIIRLFNLASTTITLQDLATHIPTDEIMEMTSSDARTEKPGVVLIEEFQKLMDREKVVPSKSAVDLTKAVREGADPGKLRTEADTRIQSEVVLEQLLGNGKVDPRRLADPGPVLEALEKLAITLEYPAKNSSGKVDASSANPSEATLHSAISLIQKLYKNQSHRAILGPSENLTSIDILQKFTERPIETLARWQSNYAEGKWKQARVGKKMIYVFIFNPDYNEEAIDLAKREAAARGIAVNGDIFREHFIRLTETRLQPYLERKIGKGTPLFKRLELSSIHVINPASNSENRQFIENELSKVAKNLEAVIKTRGLSARVEIGSSIVDMVENHAVNPAEGFRSIAGFLPKQLGEFVVQLPKQFAEILARTGSPGGTAKIRVVYDAKEGKLKALLVEGKKETSFYDLKIYLPPALAQTEALKGIDYKTVKELYHQAAHVVVALFFYGNLPNYVTRDLAGNLPADHRMWQPPNEALYGHLASRVAVYLAGPTGEKIGVPESPVAEVETGDLNTAKKEVRLIQEEIVRQWAGRQLSPADSRTGPIPFSAILSEDAQEHPFYKLLIESQGDYDKAFHGLQNVVDQILYRHSDILHSIAHDLSIQGKLDSDQLKQILKKSTTLPLALKKKVLEEAPGAYVPRNCRTLLNAVSLPPVKVGPMWWHRFILRNY